MCSVNGTTAPIASPRTALGRFLVGGGVEIGPGHMPFPLVFGGATARFVDRWDPETNRQLFPEVAEAGFVEPDILANLDTDRLSAFADESLDFVIASHVLEHLAEPIGQIVDIHRVLRPGGIFLLVLPDRRRTFDRHREATPLGHLIDEHRAGVTMVDDAHVAEFVAMVPENWGGATPPPYESTPFDQHRQRSIHVHCWTEGEFAEVVAYSIVELGMGWELIDRLRVDDVDDGIEFGMVLRRPTVDLPWAEAGERFWKSWHSLDRGPQPPLSFVAPDFEPVPASPSPPDLELAETVRQLTATQARLDAAQMVIARHERVLGPLRRAGLLAALKSATRRYRRWQGKFRP
jgi:SAM-dependent methyltransferase